VIDRTIKYAKALHAAVAESRAREERIKDGTASLEDRFPGVVDKMMEDAFNLEYNKDVVRARNLRDAIEFIESQPATASTSLLGFTDAEVKLLKAELPATKASLVELKGRLEVRGNKILGERAVNKVRRR
jgi:hypothetical protein